MMGNLNIDKNIPSTKVNQPPTESQANLLWGFMFFYFMWYKQFDAASQTVYLVQDEHADQVENNSWHYSRQEGAQEPGSNCN